MNLKHPDRIFTIKEGLPSNSVYGCVQDIDGFIWFYSDQGVSRYDGHQFRNFTTLDGLPINDVWLMSVDSTNRKWLHSHDKTLCYIEKDSVIHALRVSQFNNITLIRSDQLGNLVCQDIEYEFEVQRTSGYQYRLKQIHQISGEKQLSYEIGNYKFKYTSDRDSLQVFDKLSAREIQIRLPSNGMFHTPVILGKYIYISSSDGLRVFRNGLTYDAYLFTEPASVNRTYLDRDGNLWVCKKEQGIYFYNRGTILSARKETIIESELLRTIPYGNEKLFVNIKDEILHCIMKEKKFEYICELKVVRYASDFIRNSLYLQTDAGSFVLLRESSTQRLVNLNDYVKNIKELNGVTLAGRLFNFGKDSLIILSLMKNGYLIRKSGDSYAISKFHKGTERIQFVYVDPFKNVFLISHSHIYQYNRLLNLQSTRMNYSGKENLTVNTMLFDPVSRGYWIGTQGQGLVLWMKDRFLKFFNGQNIHKIITIGKRLIVSNEKGVFIYNRQFDSLNYQFAFTARNGVPFGSMQDMYIANDTLWAVLKDRIISLDIRERDSSRYGIHFHTVLVNDRVWTADLLNEIPSSYRHITIQFSLFSYGMGDEVIYQYALNEASGWTSLESNQVRLQGLAGGNYRLHVRALHKYSGHVLCRSALAFSITVPWWKQPVWILVLNLVILMVLFAIVRRWYNVKAKREWKMQRMELSMKELKLNALESQMNPHFIYNSLSAIQYYIQEGRAEEADYYLAQFSKLVRNYLEASRKSTISLEEELQLLNRYLSLEKVRYEHKFDYSLYVDEGIDLSSTYVNTMLIQPFVENSIQHGVFHRPDGGKIEVKFERQESDLVVTISDNGIGIEKSREIQKLNTHVVTSRAMQIFNEKLDILNKIKPGCIVYRNSNLSEEDSEYKGTIHRLTFKHIIE